MSSSDELLRVAAGHEITTTDSNGQKVIVRLYTVDELIEEQHKVVDRDFVSTEREKYYITREHAMRITKPLDI